MTPEEIYQEFCESEHGTYSDLQKAWDAVCERHGEIQLAEEIDMLVFEAIRFTVKMLEVEKHGQISSTTNGI